MTKDPRVGYSSRSLGGRRPKLAIKPYFSRGPYELRRDDSGYDAGARDAGKLSLNMLQNAAAELARDAEAMNQQAALNRGHDFGQPLRGRELFPTPDRRPTTAC